MSNRIALILALAAAGALHAQEKKPAPPKVPAHSPEQSQLNKTKQDARNRDEIKKAEAIFRKLKESDAAKREIERAEKAKPKTPNEDEARAKLDKLKNSVDPDEFKEFEKLLKESSETLREEYQKLREKNLKEPAPAPSANPAGETAPAHGSFENVPAPEPIPLLKAPVFAPPPIRADHGVKGPSRDPKNPDKMLPASDPRTRTYVLDGNVRFRQPTMAMDADEVEVLFKEGQSPDIGEKRKPAPPPSPDPVKRPAASIDSSIERIVARGRVRIMVVDENGRVQIGRGGSMIYEAKTGSFLIKDWPEAQVGNRLLKGVTKNAVIRLGKLEDADIRGLDMTTLEQELTPLDLPKTPDKPVPAAGTVKPSAAPSPTPR
jgi:LptA/(LptD N-terminal domain) LPS transport protein